MFTVMTWNVQNLFRPGGGYGPRTEAAYQAKLDGLAQIITDAAPDLVGLQEIGDPAALDDLSGGLDGSWHAAVSKHEDRRGIRVAVLSRLPPAEVDDLVDLPAGVPPPRVDDSGEVAAQMGRGALRVTIERPTGPPVHAVVAHLKSKLITYPGERFSPADEDERARYAGYALNRRTVEALTIRCYVNVLLAGTGRTQPLILMGDMNDGPEAATTQILHGPGGSEIDTPGWLRPDAGDAHRLFNLAPRLPKEQRYSRKYRGREELIDHIFVSRAVVERVSGVASLIDGGLQSIVDNPAEPAVFGLAESEEVPPSDHAALVATMDL